MIVRNNGVPSQTLTEEMELVRKAITNGGDIATLTYYYGLLLRLYAVAEV